MIGTKTLHETLRLALLRTLTLEPQYPFRSPLAGELRHAQRGPARLAQDRRTQVQDLACTGFAHRDDLHDTVRAMLLRGECTWALAPAPAPSDRKQALAELTDSIDRLFGTVHTASERNELELAWSLTEALTVLARYRYLGPEWPIVLQQGITAARVCHQHQVVADLHAALAWALLDKHADCRDHYKRIHKHSAKALRLARACRDAAAEATALDLSAHYARLRGKHRRATRCHADAIALDARGGDLRGLAHHALHRARFFVHIARFAQAEDDAGLASALGEVLDEHYLTAQALLVQAAAQWHQRVRPDLGIATAEAAMGALLNLGDDRYLPAACAWASRWQARSGQSACGTDRARLARDHARTDRQRREVERILALADVPVPPVSRSVRTARPRSARRAGSFPSPQGELARVLAEVAPSRLLTNSPDHSSD